MQHPALTILIERFLTCMASDALQGIWRAIASAQLRRRLSLVRFRSSILQDLI